jgi:hypothetical protein
MEFCNRLTLTLSAFILLFCSVANAQETDSDHADVWSTIEGQWEAEENGDDDWMSDLLASKFSGWAKTSPAPRSKASTIMWDRFGDDQGKMVQHELYPLAIVIDGDVAVAHYLYTSAYENKDDEVELNNGRYTDILVRTDDGWKFIAWHGGDDE